MPKLWTGLLVLASLMMAAPAQAANVLDQDKWVPRAAYVLPFKVYYQYDAPTVCGQLGDACVLQPNVTLIHLTKPPAGAPTDDGLIRHELGHVANMRLSQFDSATWFNFIVRWEDLNGRLGDGWFDGVNPPYEQNAESFNLCSSLISRSFILSHTWRYGYKPNPVTWDGTCTSLRNEVSRLSQYTLTDEGGTNAGDKHQGGNRREEEARESAWHHRCQARGQTQRHALRSSRLHRDHTRGEGRSRRDLFLPVRTSPCAVLARSRG